MKFALPESQHSGATDIAVNKTDRKLQIVEEIRQLLQTIDCDLNDVKDNVENVTSSANNTITCPTTATKQPKTLSFPGISQILPHLYLCGAGVAMPHILDQLGVSFIISAAPELPDTPLSTITKPLYLRIPLLDRPDADLSQYFNEVADMIEEVREHGGITLVHCVAGVSRSATLCIAYLMKHTKMTLREAYQHVKAKRPQIRPNTGFFEQLRAFDEQLYGKSSVAMIYFESLQKEIPDVLEPEYRAMEEFYQRQRKVPKRS